MFRFQLLTGRLLVPKGIESNIHVKFCGEQIALWVTRKSQMAGCLTSHLLVQVT